MSDHRAEFAVKRMCRTLGVSTSGYYAWCRREPSARSCVDEALGRRIVEIHAASRGTYGVPRIHAGLAADGVSVSRRPRSPSTRVRACAGSLSWASPGSTPCGAESRGYFRKEIRDNQSGALGEDPKRSGVHRNGAAPISPNG